MAETPLDPGPVEESDGGGEGSGGQGGDGPGRAEQQDVDDEEQGGRQVERQVGGQGQLELGGHDERRVDGAQAPVQGRDQDLHRRRAHGEDVLGREERPAERPVGDQAQPERQRRQRQPDDRQVLEVPPVRLVDVVRVPDQVVEAVRERRQPQCVHRRGDRARWALQPLQRVPLDQRVQRLLGFAA